jgi:hypothetical protein
MVAAGLRLAVECGQAVEGCGQRAEPAGSGRGVAAEACLHGGDLPLRRVVEAADKARALGAFGKARTGLADMGDGVGRGEDGRRDATRLDRRGQRCAL